MLRSWITFLLALAVLLPVFMSKVPAHGLAWIPKLIPPAMIVLLAGVFVVGLLARVRRSHRDPRTESLRRLARTSPRRWANDVPAPAWHRRHDPDPALPFEQSEE